MPLSLRFPFEFNGKKEFDRIYTNITQGASDISPAFELMASDFRFQSLNIFDNEGSFDGGSKFPPLSPKYKIWKDKNYPGKKILERTGALKASMTRLGAKGNVSDIGRNYMTIGTDLKTPKGNYYLGSLHQYGTSKMPIRDFFRVTSNLKKKWSRHLKEHLNPFSG